MEYRSDKGALLCLLVTAIFTAGWYIAYFAHSYLPPGRTELDAKPGGIEKIIIASMSDLIFHLIIQQFLVQ